MNMEAIQKIIQSSIETKQKVLNNEALVSRISEVVALITKAFQGGNKLLLCGNGGSASDAQHIAAEFTGRFYKDRKPLFAEALHVNTSYLTAVANDYSYDEVYSRLVEAKGKAGDVLVGISTSGNSKNVVEAMQKAQELNMITIGFTGEIGGAMKACAQYLINVPSSDTPRIQEAHILIGHIICELVEKEIF